MDPPGRSPWNIFWITVYEVESFSMEVPVPLGPPAVGGTAANSGPVWGLTS